MLIYSLPVVVDIFDADNDVSDDVIVLGGHGRNFQVISFYRFIIQQLCYSNCTRVWVDVKMSQGVTRHDVISNPVVTACRYHGDKATRKIRNK